MRSWTSHYFASPTAEAMGHPTPGTLAVPETGARKAELGGPRRSRPNGPLERFQTKSGATGGLSARVCRALAGKLPVAPTGDFLKPLQCRFRDMGFAQNVAADVSGGRRDTPTSRAGVSPRRSSGLRTARLCC